MDFIFPKCCALLLEKGCFMKHIYSLVFTLLDILSLLHPFFHTFISFVIAEITAFISENKRGQKCRSTFICSQCSVRLELRMQNCVQECRKFNPVCELLNIRELVD